MGVVGALLLSCACLLATVLGSRMSGPKASQNQAMLVQSKNYPNMMANHGYSEWTSWFNIDHPGGSGDHERLEAIRFYYRARVCSSPLAIEARTTAWVPAASTGERVHMSPHEGFWCLNHEQPGQANCSNYHVRFRCPIVDKTWSDWGSWSSCSTSCGRAGYQTRNRLCVSTGAIVPQRTQCEGKGVQGRLCSKPCPAVHGNWTIWSKWSVCGVTCGNGQQLRQRWCSNPAPKYGGLDCRGAALQSRLCAKPTCPETVTRRMVSAYKPPAPLPTPAKKPACSLACTVGHVNAACDACVCDGHLLEGAVFGAARTPLAGARVTLLEGTSQRWLAVSDAHGSFRVPGVCPSRGARLAIEHDKHVPTTAPILWAKGPLTVFSVQLKRAEKPHVTKHPEGRMRYEGQGVSLCCKAEGTPTPEKYSWYHNDTLLDQEVYKHGNLVLKNLKPSQAGEYYCKATNIAGSMKSSPATLYVVEKGNAPCDPKPETNLIRLPHDCFQNHTNSFFIDVGNCPKKVCVKELDFDLRCKDSVSHCCGITRMEKRDIQCNGYTLPTMVAAECGCKKCTQTKMIVRGRAVADDNGEPMRFGQMFISNIAIGFTGYKGDFNLQVPPGTERLVVTFVDRFGKFVNSTKILLFNHKGGTVFHNIKLQRKKPAIPIASTVTNTISLGEMEGEDPIGQIEIPPNSFYKLNGELYNGTVQASVTFLDPRNITTMSSASSDLNFVNDNGDMFPLRTYGMFSVDFMAENLQEPLNVGQVKVFLDSAQVKMPQHLKSMKLWSLNPETGIWDEESNFLYEKSKRRKREERTFLIGNVEIRERRLFNLDVPENRRCYVKVRAYRSDRFFQSEQLEGVVVSLINMEPQEGFSANPRAWGRFDSVITGKNGACLPAFCDELVPDAYTAYVTANIGGEELEAAPSSPKLNPNVIGTAQPYLGKLEYRRTDHDDERFKKTAFKINLAKPNANSPAETDGPIYPFKNIKQCEDAPYNANHFRFYRVEDDKYEFNTVAFNENDLTTWNEDYLSWWPKPMEFRACFIKLKIKSSASVMIRSRNLGGTHVETINKLYGIRDIRSVHTNLKENVSSACMEFKCSGMLFDENLIDRTLVEISTQGDCRRENINGMLQEYLINHPPHIVNNETHGFKMYAPLDPLGHNYGIYTVSDQDPKTAKEIALGRCYEGSSDSTSRVMKPDVGVAVTFACRESNVTRQSLFQRLQTSPAETLAEMGREMRGGLSGRTRLVSSRGQARGGRRQQPQQARARLVSTRRFLQRNRSAQ